MNMISMNSYILSSFGDAVEEWLADLSDEERETFGAAARIPGELSDADGRYEETHWSSTWQE